MPNASEGGVNDPQKGGDKMKAGIVGIGSVGRAAALATLQRGSAQELILVNRNSRRKRGRRTGHGLRCPTRAVDEHLRGGTIDS